LLIPIQHFTAEFAKTAQKIATETNFPKLQSCAQEALETGRTRLPDLPLIFWECEQYRTVGGSAVRLRKMFAGHAAS
jgi:hypothetical protein